MSTYRIYFTTGASVSVDVEAEDYEAAVDKAYDDVRDATICAQCSGWGQSWSRDDGEWELDEESGHEVDGEYVPFKSVSS